ncbi:uridine diphosphate glucose pyrophosphatase NUDT14-like isoform X2 [Culicoides brevitarsis]|uniref:uridine diphosphate glucose pyrophosphatase NUDT14-like isoform X2 n=1 Tax=Culicoides brevitarsis TaxID=469753 RepID=UPI00307C17EF
MLSLLIPGECFSTPPSPVIMDDIKNIQYEPIPSDSPFACPRRMIYTQNGIEKYWDFLQVHDIVVVVLFNITRKKLILVRQFRPAVYHGVLMKAKNDLKTIDFDKFPPQMGITTELCAGIVDKNLSKAETAKAEILEECGYEIELEQLEQIFEYKSDVASSSGMQTLFYCEVTDDQKIGKGGGVEDEIIEIVEMTIDEMREKMSNGTSHVSPPNSMMGILWFLANKAPKFEDK